MSPSSKHLKVPAFLRFEPGQDAWVMGPVTSLPGNLDAPVTSTTKTATKIPRPPNAFIIYRRAHHDLVKAANPGIHNNDISIIIGHLWKAESPELRREYQKAADDLKERHRKEYPDYQYRPRKPSEKKRRTKRKPAQNKLDKAD